MARNIWRDQVEGRLAALEHNDKVTARALIGLDARTSENRQVIEEVTPAIVKLETRADVADSRFASIEEEARLHVKALDSHGDRIATLEGKHEPTKPVDLTFYQDTFGEFYDQEGWTIMARGYPDIVRHGVDALFNMHLATGAPEYLSHATNLAHVLTMAWEEQTDHEMLPDMRMGMSLARLVRHSPRVRAYIEGILKHYESQPMHGGDFKWWTQNQNRQPFSRNPPTGRFQMHQSAVWIMLYETDFDAEWLNGIQESWHWELDQDPRGSWGAGWEKSQHDSAATFAKAGRQARLTDHGVPLHVFEDRWVVAFSRPVAPGILFGEHIDGVTTSFEWDGAAFIYEGWGGLDIAFGFCSQVLRDIIHGDKSTALLRVNQDIHGLRQSALTALLARVAARR